MSAKKLNILRCDKDGCDGVIVAMNGEYPSELRARARRDHGWRSTPSFQAGGHTDLCRWHG